MSEEEVDGPSVSLLLKSGGTRTETLQQDWGGSLHVCVLLGDQGLVASSVREIIGHHALSLSFPRDGYQASVQLPSLRHLKSVMLGTGLPEF